MERVWRGFFSMTRNCLLLPLLPHFSLSCTPFDSAPSVLWRLLATFANAPREERRGSFLHWVFIPRTCILCLVGDSMGESARPHMGEG
ncbi:hypothetical protein QR685DRAFT_535509 [Neurospora intermedia]|uniref:Secreted protein n=1 Tax=Neurospora intermedia TaxID=5142 RepID=A0ABR3D1Q5_NEUIN